MPGTLQNNYICQVIKLGGSDARLFMLCDDLGLMRDLVIWKGQETTISFRIGPFKTHNTCQGAPYFFSFLCNVALVMPSFLAASLLFP